MHNIILEITAPGSLPYQQWIRNDHIVQVGSSELLDVSIPIDVHLAPVHFALHTGQAGCVIRDLDSGLGTRVNGYPVSLQQLCDGDVIAAGQTRIVIRMIGAVAEPAAPAPTACLPAGALTDDQFAWSADQLESGLFRIRPVDPDKYSMEAVAEHLTVRHDMYLAINKQSLGWSVDQAHPYLKGLPEIHPFVVLMAGDEAEHLLRVVEQTSERKATTAIFTDRPYDELFTHLAGIGSSFCLPTIFATQVETAPERYARRLMESVSVVMVPSKESVWQCYTVADPESDWPQLGLIRPPAKVQRREAEEVEKMAG